MFSVHALISNSQSLEGKLFTPGRKAILALDATFVILATLTALGITLAALGVPMGPFNVLGQASLAGASLVGLAALIVVVLDMAGLVVLQCKLNKFLKERLEQQPTNEEVRQLRKERDELCVLEETYANRIEELATDKEALEGKIRAHICSHVTKGEGKDTELERLTGALREREELMKGLEDLKGTIADLKKEVALNEQEIHEREARIGELQKENEEYHEACSNSKGKKDQYKGQIARLKASEEELMEERNQQTVVIEDLRKTIENHRYEAAQPAGAKGDGDTELEQLKQMLQEKEAKLEALDKEIEAQREVAELYENQLRELRTRFTAKEVEANERQQRMEELEGQLAAQQERVKESEETLVKKQAGFVDAMRQLEQQQGQEVQKLRNQIEEASTQGGRAQEIVALKQDHQAQLSALKQTHIGEKNKLKQKVARQNAMQEKLETSINTLYSDKKGLLEEVDPLREEVDTLIKQLQLAEKKLEQISQEQTTELTSSIEDFCIVPDESADTEKTSESAKQKTNAREEELAASKEKLRRVAADMHQELEKSKTKDLTIKRLRAQIERLKKEKLPFPATKFSERFKQTKSRGEPKELQNTDLADRHVEVLKLEKVKEEIAEQTNQLRQELEELKVQREEQRDNLENSVLQITRLKDKLIEATAIVTRKQVEAAQYEEVNRSVKEESIRLEEERVLAQTALENLEDERKKAKAKVTKYKEANRSVKEENIHLQNDKVLAQTALESLEDERKKAELRLEELEKSIQERETLLINLEARGEGQSPEEVSPAPTQTTPPPTAPTPPASTPPPYKSNHASNGHSIINHGSTTPPVSNGSQNGDNKKEEDESDEFRALKMGLENYRAMVGEMEDDDEDEFVVDDLVPTPTTNDVRNTGKAKGEPDPTPSQVAPRKATQDMISQKLLIAPEGAPPLSPADLEVLGFKAHEAGPMTMAPSSIELVAGLKSLRHMISYLNAKMSSTNDLATVKSQCEKETGKMEELVPSNKMDLSSSMAEWLDEEDVEGFKAATTNMTASICVDMPAGPKPEFITRMQTYIKSGEAVIPENAEKCLEYLTNIYNHLKGPEILGPPPTLPFISTLRDRRSSCEEELSTSLKPIINLQLYGQTLPLKDIKFKNLLKFISDKGQSLHPLLEEYPLSTGTKPLQGGRANVPAKVIAELGGVGNIHKIVSTLKTCQELQQDTLRALSEYKKFERQVETATTIEEESDQALKALETAEASIAALTKATLELKRCLIAPLEKALLEQIPKNRLSQKRPHFDIEDIKCIGLVIATTNRT